MMERPERTEAPPPRRRWGHGFLRAGRQGPRSGRTAAALPDAPRKAGPASHPRTPPVWGGSPAARTPDGSLAGDDETASPSEEGEAELLLLPVDLPVDPRLVDHFTDGRLLLNGRRQVRFEEQARPLRGGLLGETAHAFQAGRVGGRVVTAGGAGYGFRHTGSSGVLETARIQSRSRRRGRRVTRIRGAITTAHPGVRIIGRGLPRVAVLTRGARRTLLAGVTLLATLTLRAGHPGLTLNSGRTRRTGGTRRTDRTRKAGRTRRTRGPACAIPARSTRSAGRTRLRRRRRQARITPLTLLARRSRRTHARLATQPRRPRHRSATQLLHLPGQRIPIPRHTLHPQCHHRETRQRGQQPEGVHHVLAALLLPPTCVRGRHVPAPWLVR